MYHRAPGFVCRAAALDPRRVAVLYPLQTFQKNLKDTLPEAPTDALPQVPEAALIPDVTTRNSGVAGGHAVAVRGMFDRISPTYDLLNRLLSFGIDRRWRRRALRELSQDLPPGPVLDLCAGTLDLSAAIERDLPGRRVVAADFARDMLVAGRDKSGASLAVADAMRLPFRDGAFAGVVCGFGMRNLADTRAGIAEVQRVLSPGGRFVVLEFYRPTRIWTHAFHAFYGRLLLPAVGRLVSGDAAAYRYLSDSMLGFLTRGQFEQAMAEQGFSQVHGSDLTLGIASLIRGVK